MPGLNCVRERGLLGAVPEWAYDEYTRDARKDVSQIGSRITLIDGHQLADLMIEHDVGVSTVSLYPVKKMDADYFESE